MAFVYFSAGRRNTPLHKTFSTLLVVTPLHLVLDAITVYTVNHLDTVPLFLNSILHRLFIGTMVVVVYLFYRYISVLVEEETELSYAYMELMCCRYPKLKYNCDIDPDLDVALVPNFILQPIIENRPSCTSARAHIYKVQPRLRVRTNLLD